MTKEALASMPGWKRNNLKKKVQLFWIKNIIIKSLDNIHFH
jgi:hypothetical protein